MRSLNNATVNVVVNDRLDRTNVAAVKLSVVLLAGMRHLSKSPGHACPAANARPARGETPITAPMQSASSPSGRSMRWHRLRRYFGHQAAAVPLACSA